MTTETVASARRSRLRRGIVILPSAFTLGNLFLGTWGIVEATRGQFATAGWLIVAAGVMDMFDGRIARFTKTGTPFGEELDSLVDAVSFGVAPALIAYLAFFREGEWGWLISFGYITAAILRLARFNIEQAGTAKANFHGLPSPSAGGCVATFWAFTHTPFWADYFDRVNLTRAAGWLVLGVAVLMVSNVLYPVMPRFSMRTWGGRLAVVLAFASIFAALTVPEYFFFPFAVMYIAYGLVRAVGSGFEERLAEEEPMLLSEADADEARELDYEEIRPGSALHPEARPMDQEAT